MSTDDQLNPTPDALPDTAIAALPADASDSSSESASDNASGGSAAATSPASTEPPKKSHLRRLVGGTFYYGLGQSLPRIIRFLLIPLFTNILTPADYGILDLATKFGAFLLTFMQLGVPGAVIRYYYDYREGEPLRDYVTTVARFLVVSTLLASAVAIGIFALVGHALLPGLPLYPFVILAVASSIALTGQDLQSRLVQAREQASYMARLNIGRGSAAIVMALLFVVVFRWGAAGMLLSEVVSYTMLAVVAVWYLWPDLKGRFRWPMLRSSLGYGMAMIPGDFVGTFTALVTPAMLANAQGVEANGIYAIAIRFMLPLTILGYAFQTAYAPIYFSARKEGTAQSARRLVVTARNVWAAAVLGSLGGILLGPAAIRLMTPDNYHVAIPLLPILCLGFLGFAMNTVATAEIYYSKKTWWVPVIAYSAAGANILIAALTVRRFGAVGVAWGSSVQFLVSATLYAIVSVRLGELRYPWFSLARITACGAATYLLTALWTPLGLIAWLYGGAGLALYAGLLWATGDESVRDGFALILRRFGKMDSDSAA